MTRAAAPNNRANTVDCQHKKTDGPGGAGNAVTPGLTLGLGGLMADTIRPPADKTEQARRLPIFRDPTSVYRLYSEDDALVYVGVAASPFKRLDQHWRKAHWWRHIHHVEIEWFGTRQDAMDEELRVIRTDLPIFNVQGCGGPGQCRDTPARPEPISGVERLEWIGDQ